MYIGTIDTKRDKDPDMEEDILMVYLSKNKK